MVLLIARPASEPGVAAARGRKKWAASEALHIPSARGKKHQSALIGHEV